MSPQTGWMFLVVAALVTGCSEVNSPVSPMAADNLVAPVPPPPTPRPPSAPVVPGTTPPAGIYAFADTGAAVASYTRASRFVLADDGRFALQYEGSGEYRGTFTYAETTGRITFAWEGWSLAGPWEATGLLRGEVLTVSFNVIMQLTDFENATYMRVP